MAELQEQIAATIKRLRSENTRSAQRLRRFLEIQLASESELRQRLWQLESGLIQRARQKKSAKVRREKSPGRIARRRARFQELRRKGLERLMSEGAASAKAAKDLAREDRVTVARIWRDVRPRAGSNRS